MGGRPAPKGAGDAATFLDPELAAIVATCPHLSETVRAAIRAIVEAAAR